MTTKTDKIYEIAETLGYDGPKGSRITDALDDLNSVVSGGGGGGGNVLVVNMIMGNQQKVEADKTAKEIFDAANAGTLVFALWKTGPTVALIPLSGATYVNDNEYVVSFGAANYTSVLGTVRFMSLDLDGGAADGTAYTLTNKTLTTS